MTDIEADIRKLIPADGDVIVMRTARAIDDSARDSLMTGMQQFVETIGKKLHILVLDDGMSIEVLKTSRLPDREVAA